MTRTEEYERMIERVERLRNEALDLVTLSRAYREFGDEINAMRTRGAIHDKAQRELVTVAHFRAGEVQELAAKKRNEADALEAKGIK